MTKDTVSLMEYGAENFTPDYLESTAGRLAPIAGWAEATGAPVPLVYEDEADALEHKRLIHYCSRLLIEDLWKFSYPQIDSWIDTSTGRFDYQRLLDTRANGLLKGDSLLNHLGFAGEATSEMLGRMYVDWVRDLGTVGRDTPERPLSMMYVVYAMHSAIMMGGYEPNSIMQGTFMATGSERLYSLVYREMF